MTACMFVSPSLDGNPNNRLPTFLADTVGTMLQAPDGAIPLLPSTVTAQNIGKSSSIILMRKLNIIGQTVIAMAGDGYWIQAFLDEFRFEFGDCPTENPVPWIKSRADSIRLNRGMNKISVLACHCDPDEGRLHYVVPPPGVPTSFPGMGECAAAGSGATGLWNALKDFEVDIAGFSPPLDGFEKGMYFAEKVNALRLAHEIGGAPDLHWGGRLEWAFLDHVRGGWRRGPKTLTIILRGVQIGDRTFETWLFSRAISYDPGGNSGRILSISFDENGKITPADFILRSRIDEGGSDALGAGVFWAGWNPELVAVVVIFPREGGMASAKPFFVESKDLPEVEFNIGDREVSFGLSARLHDKFSQIAADEAGYSYVPVSLKRQGG